MLARAFRRASRHVNIFCFVEGHHSSTIHTEQYWDVHEFDGAIRGISVVVPGYNGDYNGDVHEFDGAIRGISVVVQHLFTRGTSHPGD